MIIVIIIRTKNTTRVLYISFNRCIVLNKWLIISFHIFCFVVLIKTDRNKFGHPKLNVKFKRLRIISKTGLKLIHTTAGERSFLFSFDNKSERNS